VPAPRLFCQNLPMAATRVLIFARTQEGEADARAHAQGAGWDVTGVTAGPEVAVYLMTTDAADILIRPARESRREHPASWTALVAALGEHRTVLANIPREWEKTSRPRLL
jgi:hypothetical protein